MLSAHTTHISQQQFTRLGVPKRVNFHVVVGFTRLGSLPLWEVTRDVFSHFDQTAASLLLDMAPRLMSFQEKAIESACRHRSSQLHQRWPRVNELASHRRVRCDIH